MLKAMKNATFFVGAVLIAAFCLKLVADFMTYLVHRYDFAPQNVWIWLVIIVVWFGIFSFNMWNPKN